jgi:DNA-binding CsgD family transcriptional regulator
LLVESSARGARQRGLRNQALRAHAAIFVVFGGALVLVWALTRDPSPASRDEGVGYYWVFWVVLGWAFVLALHGLRSFGYLPSTIGRRRRDSVQPAPESALAAPSRLDVLTEREREILALVGQARSNKDIARELVISERTARSHVSNILRKLGLSSRTEAALLAARERLAEPTSGSR